MQKDKAVKAAKRRRIDKSWANFQSSFKAVFTDFMLVFQCLLLLSAYAVLAWRFSVFWYVCLGLTAITAIYICIVERRVQVAVSWVILCLISGGCGAFIYLWSRRRVCCFIKRRRHKKALKITPTEFNGGLLDKVSPEVADCCKFLYESGGYAPSLGSVRYFADVPEFFDDVYAAIESAEKFVFIEFFIVADGKLLDKFLPLFAEKTKKGVKIFLLYDDAGSQGVLSAKAKNRLKSAGVIQAAFSPMFAPFNFGLNVRDHRKIIVADGKVGYVCGFNLSDDCTNGRRLQGVWKDAGAKLSGGGVAELSKIFLRQWYAATGDILALSQYSALEIIADGGALVVPYAGGAENDLNVCRGLYLKMIHGAKKKLYIMTPYFVPDGEIIKELCARAKAGCDVRLVLPQVPDYPFIYSLTKANADKLIKSGVKAYFAENTFIHAKVCLTESCLSVGSCNFDMRSFFCEYDNGVFTCDGAAMLQAQVDFEKYFVSPAKARSFNIFRSVKNAFLRLLSPLM